jgi:DNA-binding NarL/FixJ family response regulator
LGAIHPQLVFITSLHPDAVLHPYENRYIRQEFPSDRVIVLSTYDRDEDIFRGLQVGEMGYLLKDTEPAQLLEAIRAVHTGYKQIPPEVGAKLVERMNSQELSSREREVMRLLALGKSNQEIGATLHITASTVKFQVNKLMSKLGVTDRLQVVLAALKRGIISL